MHNYNLCILLIGHFSCSMRGHDCEHCAFSQFTVHVKMSLGQNICYISVSVVFETL